MSLTRMLDSIDSVLSAKVIFQILEKEELAKRVYYESLSIEGKMKSFLMLTQKGLDLGLGKNVDSYFRPGLMDIKFNKDALSSILEVCSGYLLKEAKKKPSKNKQEAVTAISGYTFVITGTLKSMERSVAKAMLENLGAKVAGSVSAKTHALVAGEKAGSKLSKAQDLGVEILDEPAFIELLKSHGIAHDA